MDNHKKFSHRSPKGGVEPNIGPHTKLEGPLKSLKDLLFISPQSLHPNLPQKPSFLMKRRMEKEVLTLCQAKPEPNFSKNLLQTA